MDEDFIVRCERNNLCFSLLLHSVLNVLVGRSPHDVWPKICFMRLTVIVGDVPKCVLLHQLDDRASPDMMFTLRLAWVLCDLHHFFGG